MMECRTLRSQWQESVSISKTPLDDTLHCIDSIALGVVHQNIGSLHAADTAHHILIYTISCSGASGIVTIHIPVKILESQIRYRFSKFGHNALAIVSADSVGSAARET